MHLDALVRIRERWVGSHADWYERYLKHFGLPQVLPYRRAELAGQQIGGVQCALQFEVLMASLMSYVREPSLGSRLALIDAQYKRAVALLVGAKSEQEIEVVSRIDFRVLGLDGTIVGGSQNAIAKEARGPGSA